MTSTAITRGAGIERGQSQGKTVEEALVNIREAIELFLETMSDEGRSAALSQEILTTAVEVHA